MAKIIWVLVILIILIIIGLLGWGSFSYFSQKNRISSLQLKNFNMKITSPAFGDNQMIPAKYTCNGEGVNPPLTISDTPANAQSLVLIVNDPDSPSGTFKHWIIFNIAPETAEIKENSVPEGAVQLKNDFGNANSVTSPIKGNSRNESFGC